MNALATINPEHSLSVSNPLKFCELLAEANLLPDAYVGRPGNVLLAVELGRALGLNPVVAIQGVHIIKGKPTLSASLMAAVVRSAGHQLRVQGDAESCTATLVRRDDKDFVYKSIWTTTMAKTAKLLPGGADSNWAKYPQEMLKARAISSVCRMGASDALSGCVYTPEELGGEEWIASEPAQPKPEKGKDFNHISVSAPIKVSAAAPVSVEEEKPKTTRKSKIVETEQAVLVEEPAPEPPSETPELKAARSKVWSLSKSLWAENAEAKFEETMGEHPRVIKVTSIPDCQLWIEKLETLLDEKYINAEFAG